MYGPTIFQLSRLFDVFCQERVPILARKMAACARVHRYCVISRFGVTSRTWRALCLMHRKRGEVSGMHVCVEMETWWDGKEVNNELYLQLHFVCTDDNEKPYLLFVRPSSLRCLGTTRSFAFSTFPVVPARCFANGMTTHCCQPWESRVYVCVCVCRRPQCLNVTFFDLLNLFRPLWEMISKRHDNTVIHASHMGMLHVACSMVGDPTNISIPAPDGKRKNFSDISNRR